MRRPRSVIALTTVATVATVLIAIGGSTGTAPTAAAAATRPAATTGVATSTGPSTENLAGIVNPGGQATTWYFQYGTNPAYGSETPHTSAGTGTGNVPVTASVNGLASGTAYHYRLVARNFTSTVYGADQTFTAGLTTSQVRVMGREGFVSPGGVIGVEVGCFAGQTTCNGTIAMTHGGVVVGQRGYSIAPESGGFQNLGLTSVGRDLLRQNSVFNLLGVDVTVKDSSGQTLNYVIHLARWVWH